MKVLFLGNNRVGLEVLQWLTRAGVEIVGLVLHPAAQRKFGDEIAAAVIGSNAAVLDAEQLREPATLQAIEALGAEIAVSVYFGYILKPVFLDLFPKGCINLHPSLLPYNRGAHPNVWSIVEGTPAGVTLHYVDSGIDSGDIIVQREVAVEAVDTGATLYRKLENAACSLFAESWPAVQSGRAPRHPQPRLDGTAHRVKDIRQLDELVLDQTYTARDLINRLRARTFPPFDGCYFLDGGRKIFLDLNLRYSSDE